MQSERLNKKESSQDPIRISFGAIHTYAYDKTRRYVIIDVGEGDWFIASQIFSDCLGVTGTGHASDIQEIVGHMNVETILKGLQKTNGSLSGEIQHLVLKAALKPPRDLQR